MKLQPKFSKQIVRNIDLICDFMGNSSDFVVREITIGRNHAALFYLDGMVDMQKVQDNVIRPLHEFAYSDSDEMSLPFLKNSILDVGEASLVQSFEDALDQILSGGVLLLLDGIDEGLVISLPGWEERSITESKAQPVIRGPQESFTETLRTNTTMVRRRVKDTRVRLTNVKVGEKTKTDISVMYMDGIADQDMVLNLISRLESMSVDRVLEGEYLEESLTEKKQFTIFPIFYNSDRPDSIAAGVMDGKIAIFVDGTPFVILAPAVFVDFIQSAEDYYQSYIYSSIIRILRYISLGICMLAPAIYVALTTFHQDMIPTVLLLSLSAQREGVPFPAFVEAIIMEVIFEILREAGLRMPRTVGQAVSIVGSIVIGQAAVEANIVSPVMVIVVAITAISSFVIPSYTMAIPIRILRFVFIGLAAIYGVYGLTVGMLILFVHLNSLHSLGVPYMSPSANYNSSKQSDAVLRFPFRNKTKQHKKQKE
ncbi:spore germination protein [Paenibacillus amylolyticus]|uniref:spore germination protein n=1 Tax=Paenibacillus amylolyticus TaxID=1451 RepID=UPI001059FBAF|nr:spore germination protein [Paenibacillus amylolyticus]TDL69082.1 spore germination protein [Paenibacillus amylolyticus]